MCIEPLSCVDCGAASQRRGTETSSSSGTSAALQSLPTSGGSGAAAAALQQLLASTARRRGGADGEAEAEAAVELMLATRDPLRLGERVRVRAKFTHEYPPEYGWGLSVPGEVGEVASLSADGIVVRFGPQMDWLGLERELERVGEEFSPTARPRLAAEVAQPDSLESLQSTPSALKKKSRWGSKLVEKSANAHSDALLCHLMDRTIMSPTFLADEIIAFFSSREGFIRAHDATLSHAAAMKRGGGSSAASQTVIAHFSSRAAAARCYDEYAAEMADSVLPITISHVPRARQMLTTAIAPRGGFAVGSREFLVGSTFLGKRPIPTALLEHPGISTVAHQLVKQQLLTKAEPHPGSNAPLPGAFRTVAMCVLSFEHGGDSASGPTLSMRAGDFVRIMRVEGGVADAWGAASVWWQGAVIHPGEGRSKHGTNLEEAPISTRQGWFPAHHVSTVLQIHPLAYKLVQEALLLHCPVNNELIAMMLRVRDVFPTRIMYATQFVAAARLGVELAPHVMKVAQSMQDGNLVYLEDSGRDVVEAFADLLATCALHKAEVGDLDVGLALITVAGNTVLGLDLEQDQHDGPNPAAEDAQAIEESVTNSDLNARVRFEYALLRHRAGRLHDSRVETMKAQAYWHAQLQTATASTAMVPEVEREARNMRISHTRIALIRCLNHEALVRRQKGESTVAAQRLLTARDMINLELDAKDRKKKDVNAFLLENDGNVLALGATEKERERFDEASAWIRPTGSKGPAQIGTDKKRTRRRSSLYIGGGGMKRTRRQSLVAEAENRSIVLRLNREADSWFSKTLAALTETTTLLEEGNLVGTMERAQNLGGLVYACLEFHERSQPGDDQAEHVRKANQTVKLCAKGLEQYLVSMEGLFQPITRRGVKEGDPFTLHLEVVRGHLLASRAHQRITDNMSVTRAAEHVSKAGRTLDAIQDFVGFTDHPLQVDVLLERCTIARIAGDALAARRFHRMAFKMHRRLMDVEENDTDTRLRFESALVGLNEVLATGELRSCLSVIVSARDAASDMKSFVSDIDENSAIEKKAKGEGIVQRRMRRTSTANLLTRMHANKEAADFQSIGIFAQLLAFCATSSASQSMPELEGRIYGVFKMAYIATRILVRENERARGVNGAAADAIAMRTQLQQVIVHLMGAEIVVNVETPHVLENIVDAEMETSETKQGHETRGTEHFMHRLKVVDTRTVLRSSKQGGALFDSIVLAKHRHFRLAFKSLESLLSQQRRVLSKLTFTYYEALPAGMKKAVPYALAEDESVVVFGLNSANFSPSPAPKGELAGHVVSFDPSTRRYLVRVWVSKELSAGGKGRRKTLFRKGKSGKTGTSVHVQTERQFRPANVVPTSQSPALRAAYEKAQRGADHLATPDGGKEAEGGDSAGGTVEGADIFDDRDDSAADRADQSKEPLTDDEDGAAAVAERDHVDASASITRDEYERWEASRGDPGAHFFDSNGPIPWTPQLMECLLPISSESRPWFKGAGRASEMPAIITRKQQQQLYSIQMSHISALNIKARMLLEVIKSPEKLGACGVLDQAPVLAIREEWVVDDRVERNAEDRAAVWNYHVPLLDEGHMHEMDVAQDTLDLDADDVDCEHPTFWMTRWRRFRHLWMRHQCRALYQSLADAMCMLGNVCHDPRVTRRPPLAVGVPFREAMGSGKGVPSPGGWLESASARVFLPTVTTQTQHEVELFETIGVLSAYCFHRGDSLHMLEYGSGNRKYVPIKQAKSRWKLCEEYRFGIVFSEQQLVLCEQGLAWRGTHAWKKAITQILTRAWKLYFAAPPVTRRTGPARYRPRFYRLEKYVSEFIIMCTGDAQHPRLIWRVILAHAVEDWRQVLLHQYTPRKAEEARRQNLLAETLFALEDLDRTVRAIESNSAKRLKKIEEEMVGSMCAETLSRLRWEKRRMGYTLVSQIKQITTLCYHADDKERLTHPVDLRARALGAGT